MHSSGRHSTLWVRRLKIHHVRCTDFAEFLSEFDLPGLHYFSLALENFRTFTYQREDPLTDLPYTEDVEPLLKHLFTGSKRGIYHADFILPWHWRDFERSWCNQLAEQIHLWFLVAATQVDDSERNNAHLRADVGPLRNLATDEDEKCRWPNNFWGFDYYSRLADKYVRKPGDGPDEFILLDGFRWDGVREFCRERRIEFVLESINILRPASEIRMPWVEDAWDDSDSDQMMSDPEEESEIEEDSESEEESVSEQKEGDLEEAEDESE
ncbi:BQ2448_6858 [Microbotryum intermedium]|uniref:BQ2448_6858 protein n=1 Tax=Microbotryum intermedium TaxID=269621 RepID=A0A238FLN2_9BASI|nr:BQ2448_6858 [Microbotryum intermedium]